MFGFAPDLVVWMAFGIFIGGLTKGISGVALPMTTYAIVLNFVDAQTGIALVAIPIVVTNLWQAFGAGDVFQPIKRFWLMAIIFLIALFIGSRLVSILDAKILFGIIGASAIIFTASQLFKPSDSPLSPKAEKILGPIAGAVGGIMGGLTTVWGPPLLMFLYSLKLDKDMWVRSVTAIYLLGAFPLVTFYYLNGILDGNRIWLSSAACVPALIGIVIGARVRHYINEEIFRKLLLAALFVAGLNLIRRAFI